MESVDRDGDEEEEVVVAVRVEDGVVQSMRTALSRTAIGARGWTPSPFCSVPICDAVRGAGDRRGCNGLHSPFRHGRKAWAS